MIHWRYIQPREGFVVKDKSTLTKAEHTPRDAYQTYLDLRILTSRRIAAVRTVNEKSCRNAGIRVEFAMHIHTYKADVGMNSPSVKPNKGADISASEIRSDSSRKYAASSGRVSRQRRASSIAAIKKIMV